MTDVAMRDQAAPRRQDAGRSAVLSRFRTVDSIFGAMTLGSAVLVLVLLGGVIVSLIIGSVPAFKAFGFRFLYTEVWNPNDDVYGALGAIYGTVVTSVIAMAIAIPVGIGIAIFLTELCPFPLRKPDRHGDRAARRHPQHHLRHLGPLHLRALPADLRRARAHRRAGAHPGPRRGLFQGPPYGIGVLTAGVILGIMVLPFISSVSRDVFTTVPPVLKEAGYGLGLHHLGGDERNIVIPFSRTGVIGGIMLALGRALGETMAVTFVIGNAHRISASILACPARPSRPPSPTSSRRPSAISTPRR